jgi:poly(A) polymerase
MLVSVAQERVRDELLKTLAEPSATQHLRLMDKLSLLGHVIPELEDARDVVQPSEHYWDVFNHLIETPSNVELVTEPSNKQNSLLASYVPWRADFESRFGTEISDGHTRLTLLKLAGLLHDIAKPATRSIETSGRLRFIGHDIQGAKVTEDILRRLRLSSRGVKLVSKMVRYHLRPTQMSQHVDKPTQKALYRYFRDLGEVATDVLFLNMADYLAAKGPQIDVEDWQSHCELMDHIMISGLESRGIPRVVKPVIDGHEVMAELNISPSKQVGWILEEIREAQSEGIVDSKESALSLARYLIENTNRLAEED